MTDETRDKAIETLSESDDQEAIAMANRMIKDHGLDGDGPADVEESDE